MHLPSLFSSFLFLEQTHDLEGEYYVCVTREFRLKPVNPPGQ